MFYKYPDITRMQICAVVVFIGKNPCKSVLFSLFSTQATQKRSRIKRKADFDEDSNSSLHMVSDTEEEFNEREKVNLKLSIQEVKSLKLSLEVEI